jgi:integrase
VTAAGAWVERWHDTIAAEPDAPGVWRRKDGGFHVRARVKDPRTGRLRSVNRALPDARKVRDASAWLAAELDKIASGAAVDERAIPTFGDYAATVFERKVADGTILSAKGREKWASVLKVHLLPRFGAVYLDKIAPADIEAWKASVAPGVGRKVGRKGKRSGGYAPTTGNTTLAILKSILSAAADEYDLKDPARKVKPFDTRGHRVYTEESPNSLRPADVPRFLSKMRELFPQHYAFTVLGFTTGLRPSSLRPLRRSGPEADVKRDERVLLVRRSHTRKDEVMEATKTNRDQRIPLPPELVKVLEWHVANLPPGPMQESALLFPAETGRYRSASCLDKPFDKVATAIGVGYPVSPRAMRRTFQDLARAAKVHDVVTRAISGHATETMQHHYSTAGGREVVAGLAKVISLARVRESLTVASAPLRRQRQRRGRAGQVVAEVVADAATAPAAGPAHFANVAG